MSKRLPSGTLCLGLLATCLNAQTTIDDFEYATDDDLRVAWTTSANAVVTTADVVAPRASGTKSMRVEFSFPSTAWATETIQGVDLPALVTIGSAQFLTFRLQGDPAFAATDFRNLYLYAYDDAGNFGRWGGPVSVTAEWSVVNHPANTIEQPWDSPGLPDLSRITRFSFFQYGSEAARDPYTAAIYIDELSVRDAALVEFPLPAAPRALIDDFEGYADTSALLAAYTYQNSPAATATTASLQTPAPQGSKALGMAIDFAPGQYPWGSVRSAVVAPFSFPTNAVASFRLQGDPALATIADAGTTCWLSFYDKAGNGINFSSAADPVISADWVTLEARYDQFWSSAVVDVGNLVQWRILVEGWTGTAEQPGMFATFQVDDIRITVPGPMLSWVPEGAALKLGMANLVAGTSYDLKTTSDFNTWTTATVINATSGTAEWTVTPGQNQAFYKLVQNTPP